MRCHQVLIFSLPLTIGGAVIATPVASPPIAALRMPAIYAPPPPPKPAIREVIASWYGRGLAGRPTTSGEPFDPHRLTAASTSIPLGSVVKVENPKNGRSVRVRINDYSFAVQVAAQPSAFNLSRRTPGPRWRAMLAPSGCRLGALLPDGDVWPRANDAPRRGD